MAIDLVGIVMSIDVEGDHADQTGQAELDGLVYRFWLTFIRQIAEPHLQGSGGGKRHNLMERQLAETVEKAAELALAGTPPHKCGSFGRAALMVVRRDAKRVESPLGFAIANGSAPAASIASRAAAE